MNEHTLTSQILDAFPQVLNLESAQRLAAFEVDSSIAPRVEYLSEKCTEGTLTSEERSEYENFVHTMDFIAILKLKAKQFLRTATG
jgi:hypothetical protein